MTIILRLQGLDVKAGTKDIRTFFKDLHIPDGGVYIVGGSLREAFIAFTTEKDAQLAMRYTGNFLKGSKVTLHISSMEELEQKLNSFLKKKKKTPSPSQVTVNRPQPSTDANVLPFNPMAANLPPPTVQPLDSFTANLPQPLFPEIGNLQPSNAHTIDSSTAFLLGVCTVLQGLQSSLQSENNEAVPRDDFPKADTVVFEEVRKPKPTLDSRPGYVRLFGLPASITKEAICRFFKGLSVQEAIVNIELGCSRGCLVKFANTQDAHDALLFNQQSLGPFCVEVRGATEKMWTSAVQECETAFDVGERVKPKQIPLMETAIHKQNNSALQIKRQSVNKLPSNSPKKPRTYSDSTTTSLPTMKNMVMVRNLPKGMTKTEIKELFGCPNIAHKNVLHLLDKEGNITDTAFLIFNRTEDYDYAMNLTGCHVGLNAIEVSSTTQMMMRDMMDKNRGQKEGMKQKPNLKWESNPVETPEEAQSRNPNPAAQTCLFVRNMPADVQKIHIKRLFNKYKLKMDSIVLLHDHDGRGIGEAVIQFKSQKLAALAQRLQGQDFLGTKVLLTCINAKQMEEILAKNVCGS